MKTVKSIIVALLFAGSMAFQAEARDQGVNGLVVDAQFDYASAQPAGYRYDHRYYGPRCRDIVTVKCWYGRCQEVIRTECRDRDRWRHRDWRDRDRHWHGDRRWHDDRHDRWRHDRWRDRPHRDRW